jgi:hypothetical protein
MTEYFVPHTPVTVGEFYYITDCPEKHLPIVVERDLSHGKEPFDPGQLTLTCPYCQCLHTVQDSAIRSAQAQKKG